MKKPSILAMTLILLTALVTGCSMRETTPMDTTTHTVVPTVEMPTETRPQATVPTTEATIPSTEAATETGDPSVSPTTQEGEQNNTDATSPSDVINGIVGRSRKIPGMR